MYESYIRKLEYYDGAIRFAEYQAVPPVISGRISKTFSGDLRRQ